MQLEEEVNPTARLKLYSAEATLWHSSSLSRAKYGEMANEAKADSSGCEFHSVNEEGRGRRFYMTSCGHIFCADRTHQRK